MIQNGNRSVWIPAVMSLVILISAGTAFVTASPQLPCEFYGPVTISGSPAPVGTVITAFVNSVQQGKLVVKEAGKYGGTGTFDERLIVLSGENDFSGGVPGITFKVGDKVADQTATYTPGMSSEMALSTGGKAVTPVVVNSASGGGNGTSGQNVTALSSAPVIPAPVVTVAVPVISNQTVQAVVPVVQPSGNQSTGNSTQNVTVPVNATPVISFPSGKIIN